MARKFFSVILTAYNRADLLRTALRSLREQTFRDFEAFIIDDASADDTEAVFREFADEPGWHFIRLEENRGYPYAKNLAFGKCDCEYVTFLDSDDIWLPDRLAEFSRAANEDPSAGFLFSDGYILSGELVNSTMFAGMKEVPSGRVPAYYAVSNKYLPYVTTNVAIKKAAVDATGLYREDLKMLGDTEYFARVIADWPVRVVNKPLSIYRINITGAGQITRDWERCIAESEISLAAARPSPEQYREIMEFTWLQQSNAMIRNGAGRKARKYLSKCRWSPAVMRLYAMSFIPAWLIFILKPAYQKLKKVHHPGISGRDFGFANGFYRKISGLD